MIMPTAARAFRERRAPRELHLWAITIVAAATVMVALMQFRYATSWHYFNDAARSLFTPPLRGPGGGLSVYVTHPEFQFGPLAILAATPFAYLPTATGVYAAMAVASALGVVALAALASTTCRLYPSMHRRRFLVRSSVAAAFFTLVWGEIAVRTAHIDDAIALTASALSIAAISRRRPWVATLLLALAAGVKPWAIVFAPLALVVPGKAAWARLIAVCALVTFTWIPFVIANPSTVTAASGFKIHNAASSALRALGVSEPSTPTWVRPTQIIAGCVAGAVLVRAHRWHGVVMATLAIRLILDPAVNHYYTAGVALGVLVWEAVARPNRIPWLTVLTTIVIEATSGVIQPAPFAGLTRLVYLASVSIFFLFLTTRVVESRRWR